MIQMNSQTKQKKTHRHRKQIYGYQKGKSLGETRYSISCYNPWWKRIW